MSLQVFLQARLLGSEEFLSAPPPDHANADPAATTSDFVGRSAWATLLGEILPRALLAELKLSRMLLGSSSAEQFLLVLAEDEIPRANDFLRRAATSIAALSAGTVRLVWASTENLGAWPVARKRLEDGLIARAAAPLSAAPDVDSQFAPFPGQAQARHDTEYFQHFAVRIAAGSRAGSSASDPGRLVVDEGDFSWPLVEHADADDDGILFPRRVAANEEGTAPATLAEVAARAEGSPKWGVLRGDVDLFEARLRAAASIEEHIQLSMMVKQFFAGELALQCTYPEFWRKVTLLDRGGDGFTVVGAWDALILLARELHRLFGKFIEQTLHTAAGVEGKTVSMAMAIAPEADSALAEVYAEAGVHLRTAKVAQAGTFHLFGRTLEWERMEDAEELKAGLVRLAQDFHAGPEYIHDLASVYRESFAARSTRRAKVAKIERPWRTYMRVSEVLPPVRGKEPNNLRNTIVMHLLGKRMAGLKLRPSARVGLEWARLAAGSSREN